MEENVKLIQCLDDITIIKISKELAGLDSMYIPMDAEIRKLCSKIWCVSIEKTTVLMFSSVAVELAKDLALRLENANNCKI